MRKTLKVLSEIIFFSSLLLPALLLTSKITGREFLKVFLVSSGSMEPAIKTGSIVFTLAQNNYQIGDVITFNSDPKSKTSTTHRIVAFDGSVIKTAGDANNAPDTKLVSVNDIVGKVYTIIPYLGYLAGFIQTPQGFILFVIVPATILIYEELKSLFLELKKHFLNKFKNPSPQLRRGAGVRWNFGKGLLVIVPFLFAGLVLTTKSNSYFSDVEISSQNSFTAWIPSATPIPTSLPIPTPHIRPGVLVINEVYYDTGNKQQGNNTETEDKNEWVELYNNSDLPITIKDWQITDNSGSLKTITSANKSVKPHCYAILSKSADTFNFWTIPNTCANGENIETISLGESIGDGLNNVGDLIKLVSNTGIEIDKVSFGTNTIGLNPSVPDVTEGHSIERNPDGLDTDTNSDFIDVTNPTPGL